MNQRARELPPSHHSHFPQLFHILSLHSLNMILELRAAFDRLFRRRRPRSIEIYEFVSQFTLGVPLTSIFLVGGSVCAWLDCFFKYGDHPFAERNLLSTHSSPLDTRQTQLTFSTGEALTEGLTQMRKLISKSCCFATKKCGRGLHSVIEHNKNCAPEG